VIFDKLLSRLGYERKESKATASRFQTLGLGQPIWTEREYTELAKAGYQRDADTYAIITLVARSAKQVQWLVKTKEGGADAKPGTPAGDLLALLKRPNPRMDGAGFIDHCISYYLISGNRFVERVGPGNGNSEKIAPKELWVHQPDRLVVVAGSPENPILGYNLRTFPAEKPPHWKPWEILHQKKFNPLDDWYGMAPIEAAAYLIDISNEGAKHAKKVLERGFVAHLFNFEPGALPEGDVELAKFISDWKRRRKEGEDLLGQGVSAQPLGFQPKDSGVSESRVLNLRAKCAVFGVPAEMLGDASAKTYANYAEARRSLYTEAVIPELIELRDGLNAWLSPLFNNAFIDIDRDAIDALSEDREIAAKRVSLLWTSDLIKRNEGREELKYDKVPEDEDGYYSEVVDEGSGDASEDGIPMLQDEREPEEEPENNRNQRNRNRRNSRRTNRGRVDQRISNQRGFDLGIPAGREESGQYSLKAFNLVSEEQKDAYWKAFERTREQYYDRIAAQVMGRFNSERREVLLSFRDGGLLGALRAVDMQEDEWAKLFGRIYFGVAEDFGRRVLGDLKHQQYEVKFEEDVFSATIRQWLAGEGAKRVVGIGETTKEKIRRELNAGVAAGEGTFELTKRLTSMYSEFSDSRAERIARTEVISASNLGSQTAARSTGLPLEKEWISTFDSRTRSPHASAHGQVRDMDRPYDVMGQRLMFPGDGSLGATGDNTIMCRCTESYKVKRGG
jgi:HK97 family phage portal protein